MFRPRLSLWTLALGLTILLLTAVPASAQPSLSGHVGTPYGYNPGYYAWNGGPLYPGEKGFRGTMLVEQYLRNAERVAIWNANHSYVRPIIRPVPVMVPTTISVVIAESYRPSTTMTVDIRGPNGDIRSFPVAGGLNAIQTPKVYVLHPGESFSIVVAATPPSPAPKK